MSVVEFKNAKGEVRYQPALHDGRRLYSCGWHTHDKLRSMVEESWFDHYPRLYRSKRRASRRSSLQVALEYNDARNRFEEAK